MTPNREVLIRRLWRARPRLYWIRRMTAEQWFSGGTGPVIGFQIQWGERPEVDDVD